MGAVSDAEVRLCQLTSRVVSVKEVDTVCSNRAPLRFTRSVPIKGVDVELTTECVVNGLGVRAGPKLQLATVKSGTSGRLFIEGFWSVVPCICS